VLSHGSQKSLNGQCRIGAESFCMSEVLKMPKSAIVSESLAVRLRPTSCLKKNRSP
jgi:hypothetical protein